MLQALGQPAFSVDDAWNGIEQWQAQGSALGKTYFLGLAAHMEALAGDIDAAAATLDGALELVDDLGEHFWQAELLRLRAEVARSAGDPDTRVAELLTRARDRAQAQGALALVDRIDVSRDRSEPEFVRRP